MAKKSGVGILPSGHAVIPKEMIEEVKGFFDEKGRVIENPLTSMLEKRLTFLEEEMNKKRGNQTISSYMKNFENQMKEEKLTLTDIADDIFAGGTFKRLIVSGNVSREASPPCMLFPSSHYSTEMFVAYELKMDNIKGRLNLGVSTPGPVLEDWLEIQKGDSVYNINSFFITKGDERVGKNEAPLDYLRREFGKSH